MKLVFENFVNQRTIKPLVEERLTVYEKKAVKFLKDEFSPAVSLLNDKELVKIVKLAYKNAKERGLRTEVEHLKYLIPVMFWGSYFEMDLQYSDLLLKANWLKRNGEFKRVTHLSSLLTELDDWFKSTSSDMENPKRVVELFSGLYQERDISVDMTAHELTEFLERLWPARICQMGHERVHYYVEASSRCAKKLHLKGSDIATYVGLSIFFGDQFQNDPRYPWAAVINDENLNDADKRLQLGEGVLSYWNGLLGDNNVEGM